MISMTKIKWLYLARFFSLTGSQILFFVVPLLIFKLTHNALYTGIAFSLEWTARIISFPLSGLFADKLGAKKIYIFSDFMIALLALISIIMLSMYKELTMVLLIILSIAAGFLSEQGYVSAESLAPKLIHQSYYAKSQSILELLEQFALLFGPTIAGIFILYFNPNSLITISFVLYTVSALAMNMIDIKNDMPLAKEKNTINNFLIGFSTISNNEYLKNIIILSIMMNFIFGLLTGSAPIFVLGIYSMSDKYYALLNLSAGVAGIFAIYILNMFIKKHSIVSVGIGAYLITCILCILVGNSQTYAAYLILYALFYATSGAFSVFFRSERARVIPSSILGRTIGATIFITFLLFPLAGLLISATQKYLTLGHLISYTGLLFLVIGAMFLSKTFKVNKNSYADGEV